MFTKEKLYDLYVNQGLTAQEIAKPTGRTTSSVYYWLKKFSIPRRTSQSYKINDLTGRIFGTLTVVCRNQVSKNLKWDCRCECGETTSIDPSNLKKAKSCGARIHHPYWTGFKEISGYYFGKLRSEAKTRGYEFSVSIKYMWELFLKQKRRCSLSGIYLYFAKIARSNKQTASLDRIDNSKGYTEQNVQWVHKDINRMKWAFSQQRFIELCKAVVENERD